MKGFTLKTRVPYQGIGPDLTVRFPNLTRLLLEASLMHTESTPYNMAWYAENQKGFVLTNWQVSVVRSPKWNEEVSILTWPTYFKGILAERSFRMSGQNGEPLAYANTGWVFTDLQKRRPVRPGADILAGYGEIGEPFMPRGFDMPDYSLFKTVKTAELAVSRREIDSNSHVNNTSYIEWAMDLIPDNLFETHTVTGMVCGYKKECRYGDRLSLHGLVNPENFENVVVLIKEAKGEGRLICHMSFTLSKKPR